MRLPIDQIIVSKDNPRKNFDEEGLRRLGESIKSHGQIQPIVVRSRGQNYELLVGERRLRASALVGLGSIEAEVRQVDDSTAMELRLIENTQREDLTDAEKGDAVLALWANYDKYETLEDIAMAIGFTEGTIKMWIYHSKYLPLKTRNLISTGIVSNRAIRPIVKYPATIQEKLIETINKRKIPTIKVSQFTKLYDANPQRDLNEIADEVLGIETVTVSKDKIPKEVLQKINEEKAQFAKIQKLRTPRKKPSKPITKEQVKKKFENKKKKIANSTFKFEKVRVSTGKSNNNSVPLKPKIKPVIVHNENNPDYSLCKCADCPLFGKHCKGRCWND